MIGLEPEQITIKPKDEEETFEETMESVDIPKVQERKPQREKARKSKVMTSPTEPKSISRLHSELRKHSDARKKLDSAILDIRKELNDLLPNTSCNHQRSPKTNDTDAQKDCHN